MSDEMIERGVNCPDCGGRIASACPHCGAEPVDISAIEATTVKGDGLVGWQPIETAPKDGSEVDLWGYPIEDSTVAVRMVDCHFHCGEWLRWDASPNDEPGWAEVYLPTNWMPLPAAPGEDTPETADTITTLKGEIERRDAALAEIERLVSDCFAGHLGAPISLDAISVVARQALSQGTDNVA